MRLLTGIQGGIRWVAIRVTLVAVTLPGFLSAMPVAEPFVPTNSAQVLEQLPLKPVGIDATRLRTLRKQHDTDPSRLETALDLTRLLVSRASNEGDPRFLGQAEAVLSPWWDSAQAPPEALVLRGVIEQSRHQFRDAVTTLRRATILNPRDPQVWMTLASVYTVRGEYDEARRCCARLAPLADALTLVTTTASVTSLTGSADPSLSALEVELRRAETDSSEAMATRRVWAETLAGEIAERLGRLPVAERHFQNALHLRPSDPYALAAYADFLLNAHRFREVSDLLAKRHRLDALFLRAVEAEVSDTGSDPAQAARDTANLGARFDEMRLRGERVHMREEARFRLHSLKDPKSAATLAAQNWEVQREPADVRLLLETALATGDASMAAKAREWMGTHRTEDAVFARLDGSMIARP